MKGRSFRERLLESTRGQVLMLLRGTPRTVNDLAAALKLTDNAVRTHLATLERDGLVERQGMQAGVRRPHVTYGLTADAEQFFPKAYGPLLNQLFASVSKRLTPREIKSSMREIGRAVAASLAATSAGPVPRLRAAIDTLAALGGAARVEEENGQTFIRGNDCPLAALTANHPDACLIAESLLTEIVGVSVRERCTHGDRPRCCFQIGTPEDGPSER